MVIDYPPEFPQSAIAAVEAERLRAEQDFDEATADKTPFALTANPYMCEQTGRLLKEYIFRPFVLFSKEACRLGREGIWSIDKLQRECEDYLRRSANEACREKLPGADLRGCWDPNLLEWIKREFGKPLFRDYKDLLLGVADAQSKARVEPDRNPAQEETPQALDGSVSFPHRAAWLKRQMKYRGLTAHGLHKRGGPDKHTIKKILDGKPVTENSLDRLAVGLSFREAKDDKAAPVDRLDIPST